MLNTMLTVRGGAAGSHKGKGWEQFTDAAISAVSRECRGVVSGRHVYPSDTRARTYTPTHTWTTCVRKSATAPEVHVLHIEEAVCVCVCVCVLPEAALWLVVWPLSARGYLAPGALDVEACA